VIAAGRPVPSYRGNRPERRGGGHGVVSRFLEGWVGGSRWKAWSSRLVSVVLKVGGGSRCTLHVLSCYALTLAASREDKDSFYDILQDALISISSRVYVLLGDFNVHVSLITASSTSSSAGDSSIPSLTGLCLALPTSFSSLV